MASVFLMDLVVWLLIGLTATFAKGSPPPNSGSSEPSLTQQAGHEATSVNAVGNSSALGRGVNNGSSPGINPGEMIPSTGSEFTAPRRRSKRCTCYTYKDKECVYYCHLDIIWINTPERMVPYGLSSYRGSQRMKRSVERVRSEGRAGAGSHRCSCVEGGDPQCESFCRERYKGDSAQKQLPQKRLGGKSFLPTDSRTGLFTAPHRHLKWRQRAPFVQ
ncbi:endothelin-3-like [Polyodon spathula]|uniref:endothelin-3-like n=1 Tax=Polyodon spathula TaxID=7913 RepID=UPI001B7DA7F0|nr:endothelin-3-like [Polyodon spathula]